jgi:hypothetical protein
MISVFTLSVPNIVEQSTDSRDELKLAGLSSLSFLLGVRYNVGIRATILLNSYWENAHLKGTQE